MPARAPAPNKQWGRFIVSKQKSVQFVGREDVEMMLNHFEQEDYDPDYDTTEVVFPSTPMTVSPKELPKVIELGGDGQPRIKAPGGPGFEINPNPRHHRARRGRGATLAPTSAVTVAEYDDRVKKFNRRVKQFRLQGTTQNSRRVEKKSFRDDNGMSVPKRSLTREEREKAARRARIQQGIEAYTKKKKSFIKVERHFGGESGRPTHGLPIAPPVIVNRQSKRSPMPASTSTSYPKADWAHIIARFKRDGTVPGEKQTLSFSGYGVYLDVKNCTHSPKHLDLATELATHGCDGKTIRRIISYLLLIGGIESHPGPISPLFQMFGVKKRRPHAPRAPQLIPAHPTDAYAPDSKLLVTLGIAPTQGNAQMATACSSGGRKLRINRKTKKLEQLGKESMERNSGDDFTAFKEKEKSPSPAPSDSSKEEEEKKMPLHPLDGQRLDMREIKCMLSHNYCFDHTTIAVKSKIVKYTGDQRLFSAQNVKEIQRDFYIEEVTFDCVKWWVFWARLLSPVFLVARHKTSPFSTWAFFSGYMKLWPFAVTISALFAISALSSWFYYIPLVVAFGPLLNTVLNFLGNSTLLWHRRTIVYVPHLVTYLAGDFKRGANEDVYDMGALSAIMRGPSFPHKDSLMTKYNDGTIQAARAYLQMQDFSMAVQAGYRHVEVVDCDSPSINLDDGEGSSDDSTDGSSDSETDSTSADSNSDTKFMRWATAAVRFVKSHYQRPAEMPESASTQSNHQDLSTIVDSIEERFGVLLHSLPTDMIQTPSVVAFANALLAKCLHRYQELYDVSRHSAAELSKQCSRSTESTALMISSVARRIRKSVRRNSGKLTQDAVENLLPWIAAESSRLSSLSSTLNISAREQLTAAMTCLRHFAGPSSNPSKINCMLAGGTALAETTLSNISRLSKRGKRYLRSRRLATSMSTPLTIHLTNNHSLPRSCEPLSSCSTVMCSPTVVDESDRSSSVPLLDGTTSQPVPDTRSECTDVE